ncbi:MAG: polysaccharide deacetylase family protein [Pseudohongiellaceae bacterium]|nr:polysaccharide deacetylase family protein [Pseudohongiellaceae bacterium]
MAMYLPLSHSFQALAAQALSSARNAIYCLGISLFACSGVHAAQSAVVVLYHHVSDDTPASTSISPERFEAHMQLLANEGYTVVSLPELLQDLKSEQTVPDKAVAITFDDGYSSIYDTAFPMLQSFGYPFTVFINTQPINDQLGGYMSWEQIRAMSDAGVTIANHMVNHPHMIDPIGDETNNQRLERLEQELLQAQAEIKRETGQDHRFMAYPYGEYDSDIKALLQKLDFEAFGQQSGAIGPQSDFLALPRFPFGGNYVEIGDFRQKTQTLAFDVRNVTPQSPITADTSPDVRLQFMPADYHINELACYAGGQPMTMNWLDKAAGIVSLSTDQEFRSRRFRYLCTAPHLSERSRYYWYSKDWTRSTPSNQD